MGGKYDSYDWEYVFVIVRPASVAHHLCSAHRELPADVQSNYTTLGWSKAVWDSDGKAKTEDLDWCA